MLVHLTICKQFEHRVCSAALNLSSVTKYALLTLHQVFEKHVNHINLEDKNESMETVNQTAFELFSDQNIGKRILLNIKERENSCVEQKG